jgi:hypothetical protein
MYYIIIAKLLYEIQLWEDVNPEQIKQGILKPRKRIESAFFEDFHYTLLDAFFLPRRGPFFVHVKRHDVGVYAYFVKVR